MTLGMELRDRSRDAAGIEVRIPDDGKHMQHFTGHAAVFNTRTAIGNPLTWGFYEEVAAGTFTRTLSNGDARFLVDHNTALLVARVSADDLRLAEDGEGLAVDADLDTEVSYVRDLIRNLEKRRITGMSFGFQVVRDEWATETVETSDGQEAEVEVRTITEAKLFEVSAVTFPAYEETDAAVRALAQRDDPDPLGRRGNLHIPSRQRDTGESTRAARTASAPGESTRLLVSHADLEAQAFALRYGLTIPHSHLS